jgi:UDP-glucose 4-epimerase
MAASLRHARVLVTGGAGLVGSHIVDELVREGASVVVYDSLVRGREEHLAWAREHGAVEIVPGDLRDETTARCGPGRSTS